MIRPLKYSLYILLILFSVLTAGADNRGIPFLRNFQSTEYKAHNRNFDVACDDYGSVFFANFEGVVYYDGALWRTIHAPGTNRITRIVWDKQRRFIWVGGFNFFGYLEPDNLGRMQLHAIASDTMGKSIGEVDGIKLYRNDVFVHITDGKCYKAEGTKRLVPYRGSASFSGIDLKKESYEYTKGIHVSFDPGTGVQIKSGSQTIMIDEKDGLCSNSVNFLMYDRRHTVWGATDHGVFAMETPSPFSHIADAQGLHGDVYCINELAGSIYVGTLQGLYRIDNGDVTHVPGINLACWQLTKDGNSLLASTTTGVYRITPSRIKQIETDYTLATIPAPQGGYYTAQVDSVIYVPNEDDDYHYTCLAHVEKGTSLQLRGKSLIVETINGQQWSIQLAPPHKCSCTRATVDFKTPKIEYMDALGRQWKTDNKGQNLEITSPHNSILGQWIHPLKSRSLNAIYCGKDNSLWVGGDFGVINCDFGFIKRSKSKLYAVPVYIRQITVMGDSVVWGGYSRNGYAPKTAVDGIELPSDCRSMTVCFSSRDLSFVNPTMYQYRILENHWWNFWSDEKKGRWSTYSTDTWVDFNNMQYGETELEIRARDLFGNTSIATVSWYVDYPFYMTWEADALYIVLLILGIRAFNRYRLKKLERDKEQLEKAVKKATAEISRKNEVLSKQTEVLSQQKEELSQQKEVLSQQKEVLSQQKEELSQRSTELASTLDQLQKTQADLVRMERTATAGKLTQGLIDRILNPLNYINNFSKLTSGLAKDLTADLEDEKGNMSEDNYEDCEDILDMMNQNLTKIQEHGVNTTRTLRAMEAMLNQQTGPLRPTDLSDMCKHIAEVTADMYKDMIAQYQIAFTTDIAADVMRDADPESLTSVLKALLANSFYAVEKRMKIRSYANPEVTLSLSCDASNDSQVIITIHDNGIGIEDTIKAKVFDPFFTTKPTCEAAGVGLYLAREVVQDHKGEITVNSEKENFTDFTITL